MGTTIGLSKEIKEYLSSFGVREHPVLARCRAETAAMGGIARMQIAPEQGAFLAMLAKVMGVRRVLEVGVFTGYSSTAFVLAMGQEGRLTACDISDEFVAKARTYWRAAGIENQIEARVAPARDSLVALLADGRANLYDLAFIDADKTGYDAYYEAALRLVRPGGLIAIDNTLWGGRVAEADETDADTTALKALNLKIHGDERVDMVLTPIGDGLTLARRR